MGLLDLDGNGEGLLLAGTELLRADEERQLRVHRALASRGRREGHLEARIREGLALGLLRHRVLAPQLLLGRAELRALELQLQRRLVRDMRARLALDGEHEDALLTGL